MSSRRVLEPVLHVTRVFFSSELTPCSSAERLVSQSSVFSVSALSKNLRSSILKSYRAAGTRGPVSVSSTSVFSRHQMKDASALFWDQFCRSGAVLAEQR